MMGENPGNKLLDFDQLWNYDNLTETENQFRALLPLASTSGNTAYLAELLTQLARTLGLQQRFEEAHSLLDEVEALLMDDLVRPRLRYLLERGRVLNSSGSPDQARPLFVAAWEQAQEAGEDFYAVDAAHMIAITEAGQAALEWNMKALHLAESSTQARAQKWLGSLYNNIGWTYHDLGQYETALEIFEKALKYREVGGDAQLIRVARWCVARTLRSLGRIEEALTMQRALFQEAAQSNEKPGYTYEELGECLLLLKREGEAAPYFALAYEVLSQDPWLSKNEPERLQRLKRLSQPSKSGG
jgi:tetratricopeptide (TPR) repeat protein